MTLKEMKEKTFSLIEEYNPEYSALAEDEDVVNKINGVVNQIQMDLMPYRKIGANLKIEISENDDKTINLEDYIDDCYQLVSIIFDKEVDYKNPIDKILILPEDYVGSLDVYYYKYPELCKTSFSGETEEEIEAKRAAHDKSYTFELDPLLLEIMPYGIAADLLKMDMISNYGKYFYERYMEKKNSIDTRKTNGSVRILGGVDF